MSALQEGGSLDRIEKIIFVGKRAICREPMAAAILQREHLNFPVEEYWRGALWYYSRSR